MSNLKNYIPGIIESLKSIDPYQIYLFGSVSVGKETADSDIDLVVILNSDIIPKSYDEKLENKILVRDAIIEISMEVPIDLLVYSRTEFTKLKEINRQFESDILEKGSLIYEKAS
ncbi:MAG: nucleotidyltransferase domain-containing protein [Spirochaetia bacterium]|jgi:predicted nucleotidyltransferase|nr:nucleotidyltransferase domain-containing protein [Spirochaetia bacterium]